MARKQYNKQPLHEHNKDRLIEISSYFRNLRLFSNLSQVEVAEESGVPLASIKRIESGYFGKPININLRTLFDLADYYELSIREVMDMTM